ncbi:MAG TPA: aconitase X [bacterium]|nr:aconitase X [bacterium]
MKLTPEHEAVRRGESGAALARAMETLVVYGEAFGAARLVPIKSAHLAGTFAAMPYKGYYAILKQLVEEGVKVKVPTTLNPRPGQALNLVNRLVFSRQGKLDRRLAALGVTPNYSCVCYEKANVPGLGDMLAWAESSAVQFANSVLGARTNRNSILIDICSAVTGLTPEFGYLLDENRRGKVLVKLAVTKMDAAALGFIVGQRVVDQVPVIEHYDFSWIELKNMGGAMAAAGGVALFHVEGLTPEAPDLKTVFDGGPKSTITVTQKDLDGLCAKDTEAARLVVFGCPQMTFDEAFELGERFADKKVKKPTWFCLVPEARERFARTELYEKVREAGVEVYDHCPLAALTVRLGGKKVLTSSGKLYYYLAGSDYGAMEQCLAACGVA